MSQIPLKMHFIGFSINQAINYGGVGHDKIEYWSLIPAGFYLRFLAEMDDDVDAE
jgi:hypothetical protein